MPSTQIDVDTTSRQLNQLLDEVDKLLTRLSAAESTWSRWLIGVAPEHRDRVRETCCTIGQFGNTISVTYKPDSLPTGFRRWVAASRMSRPRCSR